jgi:hypothetical protein
MGRPSIQADGWWLAILWLVTDDGLASFRDIAPKAGPPPEPPAMRLGPSFAGSLSGLILEENGRLQFRVAAAAQPENPSRPWESPLVIRAAIRFEPMRAATLHPNELAEAVLSGFRRTIEGLAHP